MQKRGKQQKSQPLSLVGAGPSLSPCAAGSSEHPSPGSQYSTCNLFCRWVTCLADGKLSHRAVRARSQRWSTLSPCVHTSPITILDRCRKGLTSSVHSLLEVLTLGKETAPDHSLGETAIERVRVPAKPGDKAFSTESVWPLRVETAVILEEQVRILIFWKLCFFGKHERW